MATSRVLWSVNRPPNFSRSVYLYPQSSRSVAASVRVRRGRQLLISATRCEKNASETVRDCKQQILAPKLSALTQFTVSLTTTGKYMQPIRTEGERSVEEEREQENPEETRRSHRVFYRSDDDPDASSSPNCTASNNPLINTTSITSKIDDPIPILKFAGHAPRDMSGLRSDTQNPWGSLSWRHRRAHPPSHPRHTTHVSHNTSNSITDNYEYTTPTFSLPPPVTASRVKTPLAHHMTTSPTVTGCHVPVNTQVPGAKPTGSIISSHQTLSASVLNIISTSSHFFSAQVSLWRRGRRHEGVGYL